MFEFPLGVLKLFVSRLSKHVRKAADLRGAGAYECPHCKKRIDLEFNLWICQNRSGVKYYSGKIGSMSDMYRESFDLSIKRNNYYKKLRPPEPFADDEDPF